MQLPHPAASLVRGVRRVVTLIAAAIVVLLVAAPTPVLAQQCVGMASAPGRALVQPASVRLAQRKADGPIRLTFVGHATFLIESPQGINIITDYNDYVRSPVVPDIATMNIAHDSHYSRAPDPRIRHVLPGWNPNGGPAEHDLQLGDVHVRNVATNIRDWGAARASSAIRCSCSRSAGCASPISGICTTRSRCASSA